MNVNRPVAVLVLIVSMIVRPSLVAAGTSIAMQTPDTQTQPSACDALALTAGLSPSTGYWCPGADASLEVISAEDVTRGVMLGTSISGLTSLEGALCSTKDDELQRMTDGPINLDVITRLPDSRAAAAFLEAAEQTMSLQRLPAVKFKNCACGGCRKADTDLERCVAAGCNWWCCVCIIDYV